MDTSSTNAGTALEHVLSVVLNNPPSGDPTQAGPYRLAIIEAGVDDIDDFMMLQEADLRALTIPVYTGDPAVYSSQRPIKMGSLGLLNSCSYGTEMRRMRGRVVPYHQHAYGSYSQHLLLRNGNPTSIPLLPR